MKKQFIFLILFCILLSSFAIAVPPVTQTFTGSVGIEIENPLVQVVKQNSMVVSHIHIFNASNGIGLSNETASCYLDLYNSTGKHLSHTEYFGADEPFVKEYELELNAANFSKIEELGFIIWCNTTPQDNTEGAGGFVRGRFQVTPDGTLPSEDTTTSISITIFLLLIASLLFFFGFKKYNSKHKYLSFIIQRSCLVIAIYFMTLVSAIMATFSAYSNLGINREMFLIMEIFGWAGYVSMVILIIGSLIQLLAQLKHDKQTDRTGEDDD